MSGPYKFLRKCDLHFIFEKRTLAISTPEYFAQKYFEMEFHKRDPQINDPDEAKAFGTHDPIINLNPTTADSAFFEAFGLHGVENVKRLTFVGNKLVSRHPQCFIFSCAKGFFPDVKAALTAPPASYDACIKISRPNELWRKLIESGRVGSSPLNELFWPPIYRSVKYESLSYKVGVDKSKDADPFRKNVAFSSQNEWRAVFYPKSKITEQRLYIELDGLTDFVRKKF